MDTGKADFNISDDGDAIQLALVLDGAQVGGAYFPVDLLGEDFAYRAASELGQAFAGAFSK